MTTSVAEGASDGAIRCSSIAGGAGAACGTVVKSRAQALDRALQLREQVMEWCIPAQLERDTEPYRRARLVTGFGSSGLFFGCVYAAFYLLIGHTLGAGIVVVCSFLFAMAPLLMRFTGSLRLAANLLTLILLLGFCGLCGIEGGVRGHAIAWLAAVPLCALLLVDGPEAAAWCGVSVIATA